MARRKTITATQVLDLVERQNCTCALSGRKLTPETASMDHIVPLGRDGDHTIENIWIVDHQVNLAKRTLSVEEFVSMCREVAAYWDGKKPGTDQAGPSADAGPPPNMLF